MRFFPFIEEKNDRPGISPERSLIDFDYFLKRMVNNS